MANIPTMGEVFSIEPDDKFLCSQQGYDGTLSFLLANEDNFPLGSVAVFASQPSELSPSTLGWTGEWELVEGDKSIGFANKASDIGVIVNVGGHSVTPIIPAHKHDVIITPSDEHSHDYVKYRGRWYRDNMVNSDEVGAWILSAFQSYLPSSQAGAHTHTTQVMEGGSEEVIDFDARGQHIKLAYWKRVT